jgi:hypothetical protein
MIFYSLSVATSFTKVNKYPQLKDVENSTNADITFFTQPLPTVMTYSHRTSCILDTCKAWLEEFNFTEMMYTPITALNNCGLIIFFFMKTQCICNL